MEGGCFTGLLLVTVGICLARSEPGVWSALSFMRGQPVAGKRSTNELQELYPAPEEDDMDTSGSSLDMEYDDYEEVESRMQPYRRRRKPYRRRRKIKPQPNQYWDKEDEISGNYIDTDSSSFENPSSYESSSLYDTSSSYDSSYNSPSSYNPPSSSFEAPQYLGSGSPNYNMRKQDSFNDFLNALAAFLPIGLFLAAIPPNLIVINSTQRRKRSADDSIMNSVEDMKVPTHRPFLEKMVDLGSDMWNTQCQAQIFCQMAELGGTEEGNSIQHLFAAATLFTPNSAADMLGVRDLFQASREGQCGKFLCKQ